MTASSFIARKLRFKGRLPLVCIALSFFIIILAVAISSGFRKEIGRGVSELSGDIRIVPQRQNLLGTDAPIPLHPSYEEALRAHRAVRSLRPVVSRVGIVKNGTDIHGVLFKGMPGGADSSGRVRIPRRLSALLHLQEGDRMTVYFIGEKTRARRFVVESVYDAILDADDKLVVTLPLEDMQRVNGWEAGQVGSLELMLGETWKDAGQLNVVRDELGALVYSLSGEDETPVWCEASTDRFPQIFDWLTLIDFNVLFILALMVVVAGFNMISGLLILLFESISTIGTLKAFGMTGRDIRRVYLKLSSGIVLKGLLIGNAAALVFCLLQGTFHLIALDPANYFVSYVPVSLHLPFVLSADLLAYALILLLLQLPCMFISKIDPATTMRME